ncbi:MAG TPA: hypothetical protein VGF69_07110 [Thermoanaerobaculia bacterium]|jgi:hypothetical protein
MTIVASDETRQTARLYKDDLLSTMFPAMAAAADDLPRTRGVRRGSTRRKGGVSAASLESGRPPEGPVSRIASLPLEGNIRGLGYGAKITSGAALDDLAVRVYVKAKVPKRMLTEAERVPEEINGMPTDVIAVGDISAAAVPCGVSVGHVNVSAGTLGCLVTLPSRPGRKFILSNNHILANVNQGRIGDRVIQPAALDGGRRPVNEIAVLSDFEPLQFGGTKNFFDAAIAELLDPASVTPDLKQIGPIVAPISSPAIYQSVRKYGRTTLHTLGVITDVAADIPVRYGSQIAYFEDQLAVTGVNGWFADRGDSGSLVVDAVTRRAVGLVVAVAQGLTYCNQIDLVLRRFGAEIA